MRKHVAHKLKDPNPLNFFGIRRLTVPPPHFEIANINMNTYNLEDTIVRWINNNLKSRYYVGKITILDSSNQYVQTLQIGFEDPKELSYFNLACPYLKYK